MIKEDVKPDRVSIETERMSGIMIGAGFEVALSRAGAEGRGRQRDEHQRRDRRSTDFTGKVAARTTNGARHRQRADRRRRRAHDQRQRRRSTWRRSAPDRIALHTTNGGVDADAARDGARPICRRRAPTAASTSRRSRTRRSPSKSRRHVEGKLNGGGTPIELRDDQRRHPRARAETAATPTIPTR